MTPPPTPFRLDATADAVVGLIQGASSRLIDEILHPVPNFWDVVDYGPATREIRYSKMIGWLLDPQQDHGLGTAFAQSFVDAAFGADAAPQISPRARVHPAEWRSIDILLVDHDEQGTPTLTLVIENKTDSTEHPRNGLAVGQTTWYNWVIRGDFDSISTSIEAASLTPKHRAQLRATVNRWRSDPNDYRHVADAGRRFVYLTPRPGETAQDAEFHPLTYGQLEGLLDDALETLVARGHADAEKIVRDFRRTIHRRFDTVLGRRIRALFAGDALIVGPETGITPELAGLLRALDLIDPEDVRRGDEQYFAASRDADGCVSLLLDAVGTRIGRPFDEQELRRLLSEVWGRRPALIGTDTSKFRWGGRSGPKLTKIKLLQHIALAFVDQRSITSIEQFQREFGSIVAGVVDPEGPNPFVNRNILYDPDDATAFSPSAATRFQATEILLRDTIGAIHLDGTRSRVHWQLGCRYEDRMGKAVHLPVIRHFMQNEDPAVYPIEEAV